MPGNVNPADTLKQLQQHPEMLKQVSAYVIVELRIMLRLRLWECLCLHNQDALVVAFHRMPDSHHGE